MGNAKRKTKQEDDSLAAAMRRLEALAAEAEQHDQKSDGQAPTVEQALRLLGIDVPDKSG